ncbi:MAG TPA: hypothetical protein VJ835_11745 [Fimbriimonadaceae bacterium]|nr:hypothetical protein [Fimbriimonadaceae bacterium]
MSEKSIWERELFAWPVWLGKVFRILFAGITFILILYSHLNVIEDFSNYAIVNRYTWLSGWAVFLFGELGAVAGLVAAWRLASSKSRDNWLIAGFVMSLGWSLHNFCLPYRFDRPDPEEYFNGFTGLFIFRVVLFALVLSIVLMRSFGPTIEAGN